MRSICEMVKLAPEIQNRIANMTESEVGELIRFRDLYNIFQLADQKEQLRLFLVMVERNGNANG
jgi:hypothetical protein